MRRDMRIFSMAYTEITGRERRCITFLFGPILWFRLQFWHPLAHTHRWWKFEPNRISNRNGPKSAKTLRGKSRDFFGWKQRLSSFRPKLVLSYGNRCAESESGVKIFVSCACAEICAFFQSRKMAVSRISLRMREIRKFWRRIPTQRTFLHQIGLVSGKNWTHFFFAK